MILIARKWIRYHRCDIWCDFWWCSPEWGRRIPILYPRGCS